METQYLFGIRQQWLCLIVSQKKRLKSENTRENIHISEIASTIVSISKGNWHKRRVN